MCICIHLIICTYTYVHIIRCIHTGWLDVRKAAVCNTLQHTAMHCNTLQYAATHCTTLHIAVLCKRDLLFLKTAIFIFQKDPIFPAHDEFVYMYIYMHRTVCACLRVCLCVCLRVCLRVCLCVCVRAQVRAQRRLSNILQHTATH